MQKKIKPPVKTDKITLHPRQFDAFDFKTQFCAAIAGVRGGKTYVGAVWAGRKLETCPGDGLITAPDYKTLNDATLTTFFKVFPQYRRFYKQQRSLIELPNGKKVYCRSLDNPLAAEGLTVDWAWGDEAGKYKLLAWHSLRSRVSLTKGQILLTTTPYNMGWLHQDFYKLWESDLDPDFTVVNWRSVDNPFFPRDVYEAEKTRLSPQEFSRRYEGTFSRMTGLVYNVHPSHLVDGPPARADITLGGIDWGWSNPAALIVIKIYDGAYYVVDEWYEVEKQTGEIIDAAIALQNKWGINRWYADSANPEKVAQANTNTGLNVLPFIKSKDSITAGVGYIQECLTEHRLYVTRGLKNIMSEFETYQYPEKNENGRVVKDEPMPFDNHLMDAMRYAIMGYQPAKRAKTPIKEGQHTNESVRRMLSGNTVRGGGSGVDDSV